MGVYSPARRRLIIGLLLSSVLLLAIDIQGNSVIDRAREGFHHIIDPLERAAEVVSRPVRNAWRGITQYDELADENAELREKLEGLTADQIAARAQQRLYQDLLRLNNLPALTDYPTLVAQVVGKSPTNLDQIIEINRGSDDGVEVGMAVASAGGLVGKVTSPVLPDRAFVMLVTDTRYAVEAQVLGVAPTPEESPPPNTGLNNAVPNDDITTTTTTSTTLPPSTTLPEAVPVTAGSTPGTIAAHGDDELDHLRPAPPTPPSSTTTTTTTLPPIARDTGIVEGAGRGKPPEMRLVKEDLSVGRFRVGDAVMTSGGNESLAPPDIPIGTVSKVERRSGSAGPLLQIDVSADLERLNFVNVVFYRPLAEVDPNEVAD